MLEATPLTEGWTLRHGGGALPAAVPGCVHTDLLAAGVIPDPFLGRNETEVGVGGAPGVDLRDTSCRASARQPGTSRPTWSSTGSTPPPRSGSTAGSWAGYGTCTARTAST